MKKILQTMSQSMPLKRRLLIAGIAVVVASAIGMAVKDKPAGKYTAHEWGTFTSVQGGDGVLLDWLPLETSRLPGFVYSWNHPGSKRQAANFSGSKSVMVTLQRMETPVIYFYSAEQEKVDVSVSFPKGQITEWYPQAAEIGPSTVPIPAAVAKLDKYVHQAGISPAYTFASLLASAPVKESRIRWSDIEVLPEQASTKLKGLLPLDSSGSHYFAARETDSALLKSRARGATNALHEHEKFLFYRGVGNFATPLQTTIKSANPDEIILANLGTEPLEHLFVLASHDDAGKFIYVQRLAPGEQRQVTVDLKSQTEPLAKLSEKLGHQMAESLVKQGLFEREARAMVKTWKDSWFDEEGMRVLYVLPRAWTDRLLPLTLEPAPRELVRVMVGRSEIIPPSTQQQLASNLEKAATGEQIARDSVVKDFRKLGRFADPALRLATRGARPEVVAVAWELLRQANAKPVQSAKLFQPISSNRQSVIQN